MYTQQFIKSVKKVFLWYLYGSLGNKFSKSPLFYTKLLKHS